MVDFDCRRPISSGLSRGREKEEEKNLDFFPDSSLGLLGSRYLSPAVDFFFPCGEKKHLPAYVESNPQYAESGVYLVKFRQLQRFIAYIQGLQFRPVSPGTDDTYRSIRLPVRRPPTTGRFRQKSTVGDRFRLSAVD
ncbi:hypothetical protein B296_00033215 [Ensete ventricosum]|uniref:Uncharacterized protein n=1 Tax=Ensete ventricosum TaxID=4639 RepID=A0A426YSB9_ENSVE|nr:hypothetical protein B296_00033215 [Ensete ventricosum]